MTFFEREAKKPGVWCLSESADKLISYESSAPVKSFFGLNEELKSVRSAMITLKDAIPVPSGDIPLEDLLDFKSKRADELLELRRLIYSSYASIASSKDSDAAIQIAVNEIETGISNYLKILKEKKWPLRMFDWSLGFSVDATKIPPVLATSAAGAQLGSGYNMGALGAVLGGIAPLLTIDASRGFDLGDRKNPYRVLGQMDRELTFL